MTTTLHTNISTHKNPRWRVKLATSFLGVSLRLSCSIYSRLNPAVKAECGGPKANAALAIHGALRAISRLAYHCHISSFVYLHCELATWASRYHYFIALMLNRLIGVYWCQSEDLSIRVIERSPLCTVSTRTLIKDTFQLNYSRCLLSNLTRL